MIRRDFLRATTAVLAAAPVLMKPSLTWAIEKRDKGYEGVPSVPFPAGIRVPTVEEYLEMLESMKGKVPPYRKEVERGRVLIKDIPSGPTPYDVAYRFYQWRKGKVGSMPQDREDYAYYSREWPVRGNPIIMGFFDATGLRTPVGDTTAWCAAFVSWCIQYTLPNHGTGLSDSEKEKIWPYKFGAASSEYRDWGDKVTKPKKGDLVVFKLNDFQGHIGFVHKVENDRIWVLGGNQGAQNDRSGGEVNIAQFTGRGNLKFHSYRTGAVLHTPSA